MSQSAWSRVERGEISLSVPALFRAATALGIPAGTLLERADRTIQDMQRDGVTVYADDQDRGRESQTPAGAFLAGAALTAIAVAAFTAGRK